MWNHFFHVCFYNFCCEQRHSLVGLGSPSCQKPPYDMREMSQIQGKVEPATFIAVLWESKWFGTDPQCVGLSPARSVPPACTVGQSVGNTWAEVGALDLCCGYHLHESSTVSAALVVPVGLCFREWCPWVSVSFHAANNVSFTIIYEFYWLRPDSNSVAKKSSLKHQLKNKKDDALATSPTAEVQRTSSQNLILQKCRSHNEHLWLDEQIHVALSGMKSSQSTVHGYFETLRVHRWCSWVPPCSEDQREKNMEVLVRAKSSVKWLWDVVMLWVRLFCVPIT